MADPPATPPRPVRPKFIQLSAALQTAVDKGIEAAAVEHKLVLRAKKPFLFCTNKWCYVGGPAIKDNTWISYLQFYSMLWRFLAAIGDWDSMLVLLLPKPISGRVPAMKVESIIAFLRWKKMEPGIPLSLDDQSEPLTHAVTKAEIPCAGTWNCNDRMKNYASAIRWVHCTHGYDELEDFRDACPDCVAAHKSDPNSHGCEDHHGSGRRIKRVGQPTHCSKFVNARKSLVDPDYEAKGSCPVSPWQVRKLGEVLLHQGLVGLMFWVIVLIGINLYLRADCEVLAIALNSFISTAFIIQPNGRIDALCVKIRGKTDKKYHYFYLWADHECPDICPVRHLLVYLHLLVTTYGFVTGFLFWPLRWFDSNCQKRPTNGIFTAGRLDYNTALTNIKKWFKEALGEFLERVIGLHTLRKGAYRKGTFEGAEVSTCQFDARHQRPEEAMLYLEDAATLKAADEVQPNPGNVVRKKYKGCRLSGLPSQNEHATKSLLQLAAEFTNGLKVPAGLPRNVKNLVEAARMFQWEETEDDSLVKSLEHLPKEQRDTVIAIVNQRERKIIAKIRQEFRAELETCGETTEEVDNGAVVSPPAEKKAKKAPSNYFDGRLKIARIKTVGGKLDELLRMHREQCEHPQFADDKAKVLDESDLVFYKRTLKPIVRCYRFHCGESKAEFERRWGNSFKMKFYTECCIGEEGFCGRHGNIVANL
jgi:hypothetical protein